MPDVFTIPSSAPFAQTLAKGLIAQVDLDKDKLALSKTTIYLPTRRAVRDFPEVFARELGGAALLPEMRPLGDVDEDEFLFDASSEDLALPPAISPIRRRLLLAQLVRRFRQDTAPLTFAQAASLAGGLAKFFDDAQTEGVDLSKLEKIVPDHFAGHWRKVWEFLDFFAVAYRLPYGKRKQVINDVLELLDLGHKRDDFVNGLSRGMKQRLCLAKTLVHDPPVLILDEPTSGLDPRARIEVKALLHLLNYCISRAEVLQGADACASNVLVGVQLPLH